MNRTGAAALFAATACAVAAPSSLQAATYLTVGPNSLCGSDGCFSEARKSFTQTFSAADRGGGVLDVSQLQVFKAIVGSVDHTAVKVTFVLADGAELTWGKYSVKALGGDVVTLGGQSVAWDTTLGDLTVRLDLVVPEKPGAGGGGGFGFGGGWIAGGGGAAVDGAEFTQLVKGRPLVDPPLPGGGITAIPEPAAWAMMILGFVASGAMLRRKRAQPA